MPPLGYETSKVPPELGREGKFKFESSQPRFSCSRVSGFQTIDYVGWSADGRSSSQQISIRKHDRTMRGESEMNATELKEV